MFYGIIVQMFVLDTDRHHVAHIHAWYAEFRASEGSLPVKIEPLR